MDQVPGALWIRIRILGTVHWITDPDLALFVSDFRDANKKLVFFTRFVLLIAGNLQQSTKVTLNQLKSRFFSIYLLVDGMIRIRTNK